MVAFFSFSSSMVLVVIIAGTEHPAPKINGISDLPLKPNFLNILSKFHLD